MKAHCSTKIGGTKILDYLMNIAEITISDGGVDPTDRRIYLIEPMKRAAIRIRARANGFVRTELRIRENVFRDQRRFHHYLTKIPADMQPVQAKSSFRAFENTVRARGTKQVRPHFDRHPIVGGMRKRFRP